MALAVINSWLFTVFPTAQADVLPGAPTNVIASQTSNGVRLTWKDNSSNETGFDVLRGESLSNLAHIKTVAANTTSWLDSTVVPGKTYYYAIAANFGLFPPISDRVSIKVTFDAPSKLIAKAVSDGISLTWQDNKALYATGFRIARKDNVSNTWATLKEVSITTTTYVDKTAQIGKAYWYRVQAFISIVNINTSWSNEGTAQMFSPPTITTHPKSVTAIQLGPAVSFTVAASGASPKYQWQELRVGQPGAAWKDLADVSWYSGVKTAKLTITKGGVILTGWRYRCVVSNTVGQAISDAATLTVVVATLSLSPSTWNSVAAASSIKITVTSNANWYITSDSSWLTLSQVEGSKNGSFTIFSSKNSGAKRTGIIVVNAVDATMKITVTQAAGSGSSTSVSVTTTKPPTTSSVSTTSTTTAPVTSTAPTASTAATSAPESTNQDEDTPSPPATTEPTSQPELPPDRTDPSSSDFGWIWLLVIALLVVAAGCGVAFVLIDKKETAQPTGNSPAFCPNCGTPVQTSMHFCPECGWQFDTTE